MNTFFHAQNLLKKNKKGGQKDRPALFIIGK